MKRLLLTHNCKTLCILLVVFALPKTLYSQWINGQGVNLVFVDRAIATITAITNSSPISADHHLWVAETSPQSTPVTQLSSFTLKSDKPGKIIVQWETASENNNSHFIIEGSADGKTFTKVAEVETLATGGNSTTAIKYSYTIDMATSASAFAGLGLLGLLLLPAFRSRMAKVLAILFILGTVISCSKEQLTENDPKMEKLVYIRLSHVDKDQKTTVLGLNVVKALIK